MSIKYVAYKAEGAWGVEQALGESPKTYKGRIEPGALYDAMFTEATARRLAELSTQCPERDWLAQKDVLEAEGFDLSDPSEEFLGYSEKPVCAQ